jgi:spore coat-associated protein N
MSDDNEKTLQLTRRRALGGLLTIGVGSAAVGAGTLAAFSDTESSTGNQVTAGTLDLGEPSSGSFSAKNLAPGDSTNKNTISSTYNGSIDATVDLEIALSEPSGESQPEDFPANVSASDFASQLTVDTATAAKNDGTIADLTENLSGSPVTADQLAGSWTDLFGTLSDGDSISVSLEFTFLDTEENQNEYQGDGVSFDLTFTANQV